MRNKKQTGYIFSVYKEETDQHLNKLNHESTLGSLTRLGGVFKQIVENVGNESRLSIYIEQNDNNNNTTELRQFVRALCIQHDQESFLEISPDRLVKRYTSSGESQVLGNLVNVSQDEAQTDSAFIYCPKTEQHYVVRL